MFMRKSERVQNKIAITGILCLLAAAGCSSSSAVSSGSTAVSSGGSSSQPSNSWYQKGYQFARQSVAKGQPSDNAANFVNGSDGDRLAWCNEAYAPSSDPTAPANTEYDDVITNAPATGEDAASVKAYSQWISGCGAGLLTANGTS